VTDLLFSLPDLLILVLYHNVEEMWRIFFNPEITLGKNPSLSLTAKRFYVRVYSLYTSLNMKNNFRT
jgi:hypothetical protein